MSDSQMKLTCGACPVQLEGTIFGYPAYFRARWGSWSLTVANKGDNPIWPAHPALCCDSGEDPERGWNNEEWARGEIRKSVAKEMGKPWLEDEIATVRARLEFLQVSGFACPENADAIKDLTHALELLEQRRRDRGRTA